MLPLALRLRRGGRAGPLRDPFMPGAQLRISGVTRDSGANPLGSCVVKLYLTATDQVVDATTSDANGNFVFNTPGPAEKYYAVAYKPGSPDVEGTTVNTLIGT